MTQAKQTDSNPSDHSFTTGKQRILLIGWDAADWKIANALIDQGRMPHLSRLVNHGVMGNLASLAPCLSPMLWTSAATGKTADKHGILGFVEARSDGLGLVQSRSSSRRCKALWNMLDAAGLRSCVIAWPVSDPVEEINGVYVSERMQDDLADHPDAIGPAPDNCVYPNHLQDNISQLRLNPCELMPQDLESLIPDISSIEVSRDNRPEHLARLFARCVSVHAVATEAMQSENWDLFAVYYDAIDKAGHDFMSYRAPKMAHVSEEDHRLYRHVIDGLYEFHDAMLGRLLALAGEDVTVILMSDHGFQSGDKRPVEAHDCDGSISAEGASWHRPFGVFAMKGPGIKKDQRVYGASILDITPTILTCFGQPIGRDMDGRVLSGVFQETPEITFIDTWETPSDTADKVPTIDMAANEINIRQLIALGYLSTEALNQVEAANMAERESSFNLATVHLTHGRPNEALALFETLCSDNLNIMRYELSRLHALSLLGCHDEILTHIDRLEATGLKSTEFDLMYADVCALKGDEALAQMRLESATLKDQNNPKVHQLVGDQHLRQRRFVDAEKSYAKAIDLDEEYEQAHSGMAQVALEKGDYEKAAQHALTSLQQIFWNPMSQFRLGQALEHLGENERARQAYQYALEQAPGFNDVRYRLIALLESEHDYVAAMSHREFALGLHPVNPRIHP